MNDETIKEDKKNEMENGIDGEKQVDEFFKVMHAHVHLECYTCTCTYTLHCMVCTIFNY